MQVWGNAHTTVCVHTLNTGYPYMLLQSQYHCQISHYLNDYIVLKYFDLTKCQILSVRSIYVKITSYVKFCETLCKFYVKNVFMMKNKLRMGMRACQAASIHFESGLHVVSHLSSSSSSSEASRSTFQRTS